MQLVIHTTQQTPYTPQHTVEDGQRYIQVPVTMMTPGVRHGSKGAILHTAEALQSNHQDWVGVAVVINHPERDGHPISVHDDGCDGNVVGEIRKAEMKNGKLCGLLHINEQQLIEADFALYTKIQAGEWVEVSIGAYTQDNAAPGVYNGNPYEAVTVSYTPDHLALLPGDLGACSIDDGCGVRPQANKHKKDKDMEKQELTIKQQIQNLLKQKDGPAALPLILGVNQRELKTTLETIHQYVDGMDNDHAMYWVEAVYDDSFVYRKQQHNNEVARAGQTSPEYYQQNYDITEDGLAVQGDPVKVSKKVEYLNINKNEEEMMTKNEKVTKLIQHNATQFQEADREALTEMKECLLDKMIPAEQSLEVNADMVKEYLANNSATAIDLLPEGVKEKAKKGITAYEAQRLELIEAIQANEKAKWEKEQLEALDTEVLQNMAKMAEADAPNGAPGNYAAQGADGAAPEEGPDVEPLGLPNYETKKEEK